MCERGGRRADPTTDYPVPEDDKRQQQPGGEIDVARVELREDEVEFVGRRQIDVEGSGGKGHVGEEGQGAGPREAGGPAGRSAQ